MNDRLKPTVLKQEFLTRNILMKVAVFAQNPRSAKEIVDHTGCSRRIIERWCNQGFLLRKVLRQPIINDDGASTRVHFVISSAIKSEIAALKKEITLFS
jgi:hypothetical protein